MAELTPRQRAHLRSLAHALKPILHVGKEGVTDALVGSVAEAFVNRELLKVKVLDAAPAGARELAAALLTRLTDVHLVQVIGRTIVLYRRHPDNPKLVLPRQG